MGEKYRSRLDLLRYGVSTHCFCVCCKHGLTEIREIYGEGKGEEIIGDLIRSTDPEIQKRLFIATKCTWALDTQTDGGHTSEE